MKEILRRAVSSAPLSIDEEARSAEFVASTEDVDSYGTIVSQDWDLARYAKNPVVLYNHDSGNPIGKADVRVESGQLIAKVFFAELVKSAEDAWQLVRQGILRGMSVGFRAKKVSTVDRDGRAVDVYSGNVLFELSITSMPSNPNALARSEGDSMDPQEADKATKKAEVRTADAAPETITRAAHDAAVTALQSTIADQRRQMDAMEKRLADSEKAIQESRDERNTRKVEALIGKKITPAQRGAFLDLIKKGDEVFDAIVAGLPDLNITGRKIDAEDPNPVNVDGTNAKFERAVEARMRTNGESRYDAMRWVRKAHPELRGDALWPSTMSSRPTGAGISSRTSRPRQPSPSRRDRSSTSAPTTTPSPAPPSTQGRWASASRSKPSRRATQEQPSASTCASSALPSSS